MPKKKVLIVEDKANYSFVWCKKLKDQFEIVLAESIKEAEHIFKKDSSFDLIVMDCCVPGDVPNTMDLVKMIRKTYHGPILANSSLDDYIDILIMAGADHRSDKHSVPGKVITILGL